MSKGWISLYRQIEDCWLWLDKPFSKGQAWIDLLLLANHEDKKGMFEGKLTTFKTGTVYRSILFLSERWGWDRRKVNRFLLALERDGMVSVNSTTHGTTITIVKYSNFQGNGTTNSTTDGTTDVQRTVQPMYINNNNQQLPIITNKSNKGKAKSFTPPTVEEVRAYCQERNNNVDAEHFVSYYQSQKWKKANGQPLSDWKAGVRTWERKDNGAKPVQKTKPQLTAFNNFPQRDYDFRELEKKLLFK